MRNIWIRLGIVAGVLAVIAIGTSALANQDPWKHDVFSCGKVRHDACTITCEESVYDNYGACRDDRDGSTSAITIQCCCCTDGWQHRSFIGG